MTLTNCTVSGNSLRISGSAGDGSGGGLYVATGGVVTLKKTTVAIDFASFSNGNIYGTVTYLGLSPCSSLAGTVKIEPFNRWAEARPFL